MSALARFDLDADLNDVPLQLGTGEDVPETNEEVMILLEPEQYIRRLYQDDEGRYIWLSMIGGRNSRPFHAPDICYDADGWQYDLGSLPVELRDGGEVYGLWLRSRETLPRPRRPHRAHRVLLLSVPRRTARSCRRHCPVQADLGTLWFHR
ncbi:MAG: exosortase-associated EpsI family protein [Caldilineaceae bacterium]